MLDQLGNMHTYDGHYDQADQMLQEAQQCMLAANSLSGAAIVQYHIAILRYVNTNTSINNNIVQYHIAIFRYVNTHSTVSYSYTEVCEHA